MARIETLNLLSVDNMYIGKEDSVNRWQNSPTDTIVCNLKKNT